MSRALYLFSFSRAFIRGHVRFQLLLCVSASPPRTHLFEFYYAVARMNWSIFHSVAVMYAPNAAARKETNGVIPI